MLYVFHEGLRSSWWGVREIKQGLCCSSGGERNDFKKIRHKVVVVVKKTELGQTETRREEPWKMAVLYSPYVLVAPSSGFTFRFVFLSFFSAYLSFHLTSQCEKIKVIGIFFFQEKFVARCDCVYIITHGKDGRSGV